MKKIYSIFAETTISSAHRLINYKGECSNLHGHNWKIIAEVHSQKLNKIGMVIDFKKLKEIIKEIGKKLDHKNINEIAPFDKINPTAENIAAWFYKNLSDKINNNDIKLTSITVYETEKSKVRYFEK